MAPKIQIPIRFKLTTAGGFADFLFDSLDVSAAQGLDFAAQLKIALNLVIRQDTETPILLPRRDPNPDTENAVPPGPLLPCRSGRGAGPGKGSR